MTNAPINERPAVERPDAERPDTRQRLIAAMREALRRRGLHGIGLNELLAEAGAPKGVLYHHFPGGKTALAVAAIDDSVRRLCAQLDAMLASGQPLIVVLEGWLAGGERKLEQSGYAAGCPLATVALESTPQDPEIRAAVDAGFSAFRQRIAAALRAQGRSADASEALAALIVSAYEGGLMQARVAGNTESMVRIGQALRLLLAAPDPLPASPEEAQP